MPSSLTIVLPIALVFSTRPPVSVWGTGTVPTHCWAFLGSMGSVTSPECGSASRLRVTAPTLIGTLLHAYPGTTIAPVHLPSCVPLQLSASRSVRSLPKEQPPRCRLLDLARTRWYWNINQLCIDYAFRPRLSSRLTLGGLAFPRNPWAFGGGVSHPSLATHACILTRWRSTSGHAAASLHHRRSSTTPTCVRIHSFGSGLEPRYIVRAGSLDQ